MRGILIDPEKREVSEVETDGTLQDIYRILDIEIVERLNLRMVMPKGVLNNLSSGENVWVDEEGLMNLPTIRKGFFRVGPSQELAGRGLILCDTSSGNVGPTRLDLAEIKRVITWT